MLKRISLLLLAGLSLMSVACSTPTVQQKRVKNSDTAWWAYQSCLESLSRSSNPQVCNNVSWDTQVSSYNGYTYGQYYYPGYTKAGSTSAVSKAQLDTAYRDYLNALDEATQEQMAQVWEALAARSE